MNKKTTAQAVFLLVLFFIGILVNLAAPTPAHAATHGCYADGCTGLDPSGRCDDGVTVKTMTVRGIGDWGQLDLRWSKSCKANWGRFTIFQGKHFWLNYALGNPIPAYGRVTAWNPGKPSQGTVKNQSPSGVISGTSWSKMVNGTLTACIGVEVIMMKYDPTQPSAQADIRSEGWWWGPCY